jgi:hypothetical protein
LELRLAGTRFGYIFIDREVRTSGGQARRIGMPQVHDTNADEDLQHLIFEDLNGRRPSSVVSINSLVSYLQATKAASGHSDRELARMVFDAAMALGLVPVYDPEAEAAAPGDFRGQYGYGRKAHKQDPSARYGFEPEAIRPLPVRQRNRWR